MAMRRYIVVPVGQVGKGLSEKVASLDAKVSANWAPGMWLVAYDGTTNDLAEAIGLGDDESMGTAIVVPVTSYSGYAPRGLWEWLKLHRDDD